MRHLGRVSVFTLLLVAILAWAPAEVGAQKKKNKDKNKDTVVVATPTDYKQIENKKELVATIVGVSGNTLTFRVDTPHLEPNPKYKPPKLATGGTQQAQMMRTYQDLMRQQQLAMTATTPQARQRAMQRYYQDLSRFQQQYGQQYNRMMAQYNKTQNKTNNQNNTTDPYIVVTTSKDYELDMKDMILVRKMYLPLEFDETGKAKQYTDKEKAKLRGDDKSKPGYTATMEEVLPGAEAKLRLTPPPKKKTDAKPDEEGVGNVERATINTIVLTKESTAPAITGDDGKGKKKNKK